MQTKQPAQILLVTILVLMIISIIVVGVVSLANKDVQQTVSQQQYEQVLNVAESNLLQFVNRYGGTSGAFSTMIADNPLCSLISTTEFECDLPVSSDAIVTNLEIFDTNVVEDLELTKDESFELDLVSNPATGQGFRGKVLFNYTGTVALEFALTYSQTGVVQTITDVFDVSGGQIYDVLQGDPLDNSDIKHPFNFVQEPTGEYSFLIHTIDGFAGTSRPISLRVTARMGPTETVTLLDITGNSGGLPLATAGVFPNQVRKYITASYPEGENASIVAKVIAQVPLLPQAAYFLHSGLLTPNDVTK
jgi:type II secretory pathway pseudopilin PulG